MKKSNFKTIPMLLIIGILIALSTFIQCQPQKKTVITSTTITSVTIISKDAIIKIDSVRQVPVSIINVNATIKELQESKVVLSRDNAEEIFMKFIKDNRELLKIESEDLSLRVANQIDSTWYVKFQQKYQGVPIEGAIVGVVANSNGLVKTFSSSYLPNFKIKTQAKVSSEDVIQKARKTYKDSEVAKTLTTKSIEKIIVKIEGEYILAWKFILESPERNPEVDKIFVFNAQTGKLLKSYPVRFPGAITRGTISGEIYPENPTSPAVATERLGHQEVRLEKSFYRDRNANTNNNGEWAADISFWWTIFGGNYTANYTMKGKYAYVTNSDDTDFTETLSCSTGGSCDHTWTATDRDHINVYYHINKMHDFYKEELNYSWTNPWTGTSRFNARVNFAYNNAYAGDPMDYGNNDYARSSDIIYHECTHNVLYALFGDYVGFPDRYIEGYAFDEGFADYFACAITNEPEFGEGVGIGRDLDNTNSYVGKNSYNTEGHSGGTIIAGAAWDLRERLISRFGQANGSVIADKLIFEAMQTMATMPEEYFFSDPNESNFLSSLYLASDNNNNLLDGVPYFSAIQQAFYNHKLLQAVLAKRNSYDVSTNTLGILTGGDFYYSQGKFWANNFEQRGIKDLGNIGATSLADAVIPTSGYYRFGVDAVLDHTYVSLAQTGEEGKYIVYKVTEINDGGDEIVIEYLYRSPIVVGPFDICVRYPMLCKLVYECRYCDIFTCRVMDERIIVQFNERREKALIPVDKICQYVINYPGYRSGSLYSEYRFLLEGMVGQLDVLVYNSKGEIVTKGKSSGEKMEVLFKTVRGEKYFLAIQPAKDLKLGKEISLMIKGQLK